MQVAGEGPFARAGSGLLVLQVNVDMLDSVATDEQIAFRWVHDSRLRRC